MKALSIAWKDLEIFFKDRGNIFYLLVLPLLFIIVFSGALTSLGSGEKQVTRLELPVVNLDSGATASDLLAELETSGGLSLSLLGQADAQQKLNEKQINHMLVIPENFSQELAAWRSVNLKLVSHPDAYKEETEALRLAVEGAAQGMALEQQIFASLEQVGQMQANAPVEVQQAFSVERMKDVTRSQFAAANERPLITVSQSIPQAEAEAEETPSTADVAVPGFAVMFVFLTAQATAQSIYEEKKIGSFRRLMAAPMSKFTLLAGKMLPNFVTGLVQLLVIFAFGVFGLRLFGMKPLSLGHDPLGLALTVVVLLLCSSALGILIAALARTESQIGGLSTLFLWGLGLVGGSFIPVFIMERYVGKIMGVTPHYWANRALDNLMVRGLGLADIGAELAALLGFTVLFFAIGLWRFDFD